MRKYEMMVILNPEIDERTVAPALEKLLNVISANGVSVDATDIWGKRRLAYPIEKYSEGIYAVIEMTTTPQIAEELTRQLSLNESVLRTKLLRRD